MDEDGWMRQWDPPGDSRCLFGSGALPRGEPPPELKPGTSSQYAHMTFMPIRAVQVDPARIALLGLAERAQLNDKLLEAERALCDRRGLPDRPWFKHLIYACRYTYAALVLPGLTEAVERKDREEAAQRARVLIEALKRSAKILAAP